MKGKWMMMGAVLLLTLTCGWAADLTGKWIARVPGMQGQGDTDVTLVFRVEGDKLTGTLNNPLMPGEVAIDEGKVSGEDVSFSLKRKIGETEMKVIWKGKVSGDEIKFVRTAEGGMAGGSGGGTAPTEIIAKRAQ